MNQNENTILKLTENDVYLIGVDFFSAISGYADYFRVDRPEMNPAMLTFNTEFPRVGFEVRLSENADPDYIWKGDENDFCLAGNSLPQIFVNSLSKEKGQFIFGAKGDDYEDEKGNTVKVDSAFASFNIPLPLDNDMSDDGSPATVSFAVERLVIECNQIIDDYFSDYPSVLNIYGAEVLA